MKTLIKLFLIVLMVMASSFSSPSAGVLDQSTRISMELEGVSIVTVLNQIAQLNNINIVVSSGIEGEITMRLEDVDLLTALETILFPNGLNYYIQNDVIVVKPEGNAAPAEMRSKVVHLKFADPEIVSKALEPYKTEKGQIIILNKTETSGQSSGGYKATKLLISDIISVIDQMSAVVIELDVPERLISIKVRIIERKVDSNDKLGFLWPSQVRTSIGSNLNPVTSSSTTTTTTEGEGKVIGSYDLEGGSWTWGKLSIAELQVALDILEQDDNSELISDPYIIATENHQAEIRSETIIPIATINRFTEGSSTSDIVTFYDEEVGISLLVTPRINDDGYITLDVFPKVEDIIGFSGPTDNQKPITASRSVRTKITVKDGETAVLGGLLKEDEITTETRVPLLGHIPLLGKLLFTHKWLKNQLLIW